MLQTIAGFALTAFAIELTPGPNMAYLAVLSLDRGRVAGFAAVGGVALGLLLLGVIAGLGLGSLIAETAWLYEILRWSGVAFLLWLAFDSYREAQKPPNDADVGERLFSYFRRGLTTNLLNPKAALFYVTVVPNFVDVARPEAGQLAVLTGVYVLIATAVHASIVLGAGLLQPFLVSSGVRGRMGIVAAAVLVGIAVWLALTTGRGAS